MTRPNNSGIGPCVTTRAAIINDAHADVAVDIHADGGPVDGRGFAVLEPVADGPNNAVIASSASFAAIMRDTFVADTGMPVSTYDGVDGLQPRNNLAGLNLTTVPKVLIECGNMQQLDRCGHPGDAGIPAGGGRGNGASHHRLPHRLSTALFLSTATTIGCDMAVAPAPSSTNLHFGLPAEGFFSPFQRRILCHVAS